MTSQSLNITSYDPIQLKQSLIDFLRTKSEFADFNYEGSALLTIIDLLVRNTHYIAYMANMVATESFLDSAQLRANIVSHAQKLSYTPKSRTAATMVVDLTAIPFNTAVDPTIVCEKYSPFINTVDGVSYSFVNTDNVTLIKGLDAKYHASGVTLKQGSPNSQKFLYNGSKIEIQNKQIDTSTLKVYVRASTLSTDRIEYGLATDITSLSNTSSVYFLSENSRGFYEIEFGKGVLGSEPAVGSVVEIDYIVVETEHANGLNAILAASPIGPYSNILVTVKVPAYGGAEQASNDTIKFMAPKLYEAQERAVKESDFVVLAKRDFPFIKSAIVWGGERNVPPYYGRVFMSVVPQDGYSVADAVKTVITNQMRKYSLLVTEVVDVNYIGCNLKVGVLYNDNNTAKTFDQLKTAISSACVAYGTYIKEFDRWLNNTEINTRLQAVDSAIVTVEIDKELYIDTPTVTNVNHSYSVSFLNKLKPGSVVVSGFKLNLLSPTETIKDDGNGLLVATTVFGTMTVGTVNYDTGAVNLTITTLASGSSANLRVVAVPYYDNVYTDRNYVIHIDGISVYRIAGV